MTLWNRPISVYLKHLPDIPAYLVYFARCFFLFRRPLGVLRAYLTVTSPPNRLVELRSGLQIYLSDHPHDIITVFLIFVRRDYGPIRAGSTVVDIGANIGVFSLYAAHHGADRVLAYEASSAAFQLLQQNIRVNGLEQRIEPHHRAVTDRAGDGVPFPTGASMYHAVMTHEHGSDFELVDTTDLASILHDLARVNLLKVDCEGCEYQILPGTSPQVLGKIDEIRLEYHLGRGAELEALLGSSGFRCTKIQPDTQLSGSMWFSQTDLSPDSRPPAVT